MEPGSADDILQDASSWSKDKHHQLQFVDICVREGARLEELLRRCGEMQAACVKAETIMYSISISSCEKGSLWKETLREFGEMGAAGVHANNITKAL